MIKKGMIRNLKFLSLLIGKKNELHKLCPRDRISDYDQVMDQ